MVPINRREAGIHRRHLLYAGVFLFLVALNARPAQAQQDGFAFCKTFDRTSSYYVAGEPVYFTDLFPVTPSSPDYKTAFQDFLKQKYGWTKKTVSCAMGFTKEGAEKSYNEGLKAAADKAVRTGWTLANMPASAPAKPPPIGREQCNYRKRRLSTVAGAGHAPT